MPFTFPVRIVPAVAERTELSSPRPLYGRITSAIWYQQFYWPLVLDQSAAGRQAGHYDRLLVDRNHDGDMADPGERVDGRFDATKDTIQFEVGELVLHGEGEDFPFQLRELVVSATATMDPAMTFSVTMDHRMFDECSYFLTGPYASEMRLSPDVASMPALNLTPEIAAGPESGANAKEIRLTIADLDAPFRIGRERPLSLVCLTGDPNGNQHVFAIENRSFAKPVIATLIYTDDDGVTRGRRFELEDWVGDSDFTGRITVPADARPGAAQLAVNFSERLSSSCDEFRHFTQLVPSGVEYLGPDGESHRAAGWRYEISLTR